MRKVPISADFERRLRAGKDTEKLVAELIGLLDETTKRAAGSSTGLGYKELVALFRSELGSDLAMPPAPNAGYIVKIINRAREIGINKDNVGQIATGLRRGYKPPYSLGFVVFRGDEHYSRGAELPAKEESVEDARSGVRGKVFTGRPDIDLDGV